LPDLSRDPRENARVQPEPDSEYSQFLHALLPEFHFLLASREDAEGGLDRLREYYAGLASPGRAPGTDAGSRVAVIAIDPWRNWAAEVKAAALVADLVICDDPLLYVQDHIRTFAYFYDRAFGSETGARLLVHLARQVEWMWQVMPLVRDGILVFRPLRMLSEDITSATERFAGDYLAEHLEVLGWDVMSYPQWVKYRVPLLGEESHQVELDRALWAEFGMSPGELARMTVKPRLTIHLLTTWSGLLVADSVNGTFWTGSDAHWRLARDAVDGLSPGTKIMSFVEAFTRPALEQLPARDLLAIRADEEAFGTFRRELVLTESLIRSYPGEDRFASEITEVFEQVFRPNIAMIESAMRRNALLRDLPFLGASAGLSIAAAASGGATPASTVLGTLATVLGFSSVFQDLLRPETKVRREPAFVFWKLGVPGSRTG
jgi:hypothetical protein